MSVAALNGLSAPAVIAVSTKVAVDMQPGERAQREHARVERVEQRLLVLLQVAVVRERQRLERGEEAGEVADQPTRLAPGQLGDVGVLLLRQHRRTGRVRVGEPHEAELVGRPQHDLLAEPREVHLRERGDEQRLGDEVAVGDGVERVLERRGRSSSAAATDAGSSGRLEPASAPAPSGETSAALEAVVPAVDVARQRPEVREQVMREQHGLRALQVRVAGERDLGRLPRALQQHRCSSWMRAATARPSRRRYRRMSSAIWSLRLRPVCSFAPTGPAISVTRRSIAVWMSSSLGANANVSAAELLLDAVERGDDDRRARRR